MPASPDEVWAAERKTIAAITPPPTRLAAIEAPSGGQAPAPGHCMSLSEERRSALREFIRTSLPTLADGSIRLIARAWAVRGIVP
jgi:hypothetical protein